MFDKARIWDQHKLGWSFNDLNGANFCRPKTIIQKHKFIFCKCNVSIDLIAILRAISSASSDTIFCFTLNQASSDCMSGYPDEWYNNQNMVTNRSWIVPFFLERRWDYRQKWTNITSVRTMFWFVITIIKMIGPQISLLARVEATHW